MSVAYYNFTDPRDGKVYPCVQMPDGKWWFAKNLSYATPNSETYDDDPANETIYGRLYTWDDLANACPSGCHIPTDDEWTALTTAIGGDSGTKLKANSSLWSTNTGTDVYDFSVLPAGYRVDAGEFNGLGDLANFWSSSERDASSAWARNFYYTDADVSRFYENKPYGFSLRCIVDEVSPPAIYPPSGTFQGVQLVTLKSSQSLPIRYTLDGSEPTISSPLYISPIPVNHDTQIKASAFDGTIYSSAVSASYKITNGILNRIPNYRDHVLPYLLEQYKGDNA